MTDTAGFLDLAHEVRLGEAETLTFTIRADSPKADLLVEDIELEWRGRRFYIFDIVKEHGPNGATITVEAPALWYRLAERKKVGGLALFGVTASAGLDTILEPTGWTAAELELAIRNDATLYEMQGGDTTYLDLLRRWAKVTGYELEFDTLRRQVRLVTSVGVARGIGFRYGRNLRQIERRSNPPAGTRLYMYGANNIDIGPANGNVPYLEDYSFYTAQGLTLAEAQARYSREVVVKDSTYRSAATLYTAAVAKLAEVAAAQVSYKCSVMDLSDLTGFAEDEFSEGDTVRVADSVLGVDVTTRVVRIVRRPLDPANSEIELSTIPPSYLDPSIGDGRDGADDWQLLASRPATPRKFRNGTTILNRLDFVTAPEAEYVVGFSLHGVAVGTGDISVTAYDTEQGVTFHPTMSRSIVDGEPVELGFTFGEQGLAGESHSFIIRAASTSSSVGVDIEAGGVSLWVLARGVQQQTVTLPNSQTFSYTGAVQTFTVPDDVTEVTITATGAAGGPSGSTGGGAGGVVTSKHVVTPGTTFDVYVGGVGTDGGTTGLDGGGWPNGGDSDDGGLSSDGGYGGGGATYMTPTGAGIASAIIVAAGGGGMNERGIASQGGFGGFYAGGAGSDIPGGGWPLSGGQGGTTDAGGAGGTVPEGDGGDGDTGGQGDGGDGLNVTGAFAFSPGGGGGGWHGGGGGVGVKSTSDGNVGGAGGGGSGMSLGYDLEYTDGGNTGTHGQLVVQWETPEVAP